VWIDVFVVFLFGAVLLGGAGYLLYHPGQGVTGFAVETMGARGPSSAMQGRTPGPAPRRSRTVGPPRHTPGPLLSRGTTPTPSEVKAPFSNSWREEATPDLTGPSGSGGGGQGGSREGPPTSSNPSIASSRPLGSQAQGRAREREADGAVSNWPSQSRRVAERARALSTELGRMGQASSGHDGRNASSRQNSSTSASTSAASSNDRDVPSPPSVPINNHVYWLAVGGVLWGTWRLWGG